MFCSTFSACNLPKFSGGIWFPVEREMHDTAMSTCIEYSAIIKVRTKYVHGSEKLHALKFT